MCSRPFKASTSLLQAYQKKRKTRRIDKKGGGRQRLEKKLNRQKILEFKYVAREILSHPDVPENTGRMS